jgi:hypothetical protein
MHMHHIFVWYEDLRTCCLNVSSLGGSLTKVESLTVANSTRNLFRSIWHRFDFPFGSYSLDISVLVLLVHYFPKMKNTSELWFQTGLITSTKDCRHYIPVHELCKSLSSVLTKVESLTVVNFTRNLFRSIWHRFDFPFGSYSLNISFRLRYTESSMSEHSIRDKSLNSFSKNEKHK